MKLALIPCPFCGAYPIFMKWHGGGPAKRHVMCHNEKCEVRPSVTGETGREAAAHWNVRACTCNAAPLTVYETMDTGGPW